MSLAAESAARMEALNVPEATLRLARLHPSSAQTLTIDPIQNYAILLLCALACASGAFRPSRKVYCGSDGLQSCRGYFCAKRHVRYASLASSIEHAPTGQIRLAGSWTWR